MVTKGMFPSVSQHLSAIRKALGEAEAIEPISSEADPQPGEFGAPNADPIVDRVDAYLWDIVDSLTTAYEVDEDDALDFVLGVADDMAAEGSLPELPDENAPTSLQAEWLGVASTSGFGNMVLQAAAEE